jgi:Flp pilus assembly protein TadD
MSKRWNIAPTKEETAFLLEAGIMYRDAKNYQAARDVFSGVKALRPEHELPEILLGTVDLQEGNLDAAEVHYREALKLNPRAALAYAHLGECLLFRTDREGARAQLKTALSLDPLGEPAKLARHLLELSDVVKFGKAA